MAKAPVAWVFGPVPLAVMQDERLTMSDKAVYAAVAVVAHGMPYCDASQPGLAKLASTSRNTVAKALANLESAGWLSLLTSKGHLTRITVSYPAGTGSLAAQPGSTGHRGGVPLESITGPTTMVGSPTTMVGSVVVGSAETTIEKERNREEREAVANAPFGDEDRKIREQQFMALQYLIKDLAKRFAKPTVSPIPHSEESVDPDPSPRLKPGDPIPGTPYHYLPTVDVVFSEEELERRRNYTAPRAERPKPTAEGTW